MLNVHASYLPHPASQFLAFVSVQKKDENPLTNCFALRNDYLECLHHKKEAARKHAIDEEEAAQKKGGGHGGGNGHGGH